MTDALARCVTVTGVARTAVCPKPSSPYELPPHALIVPSESFANPLAKPAAIDQGGAAKPSWNAAPPDTRPSTATLTSPVTAPAGTVTTRDVSPVLVIVAATVPLAPANVTVGPEVRQAGAKLLPVIVTLLPTAAIDGLRPTIAGTNCGERLTLRLEVWPSRMLTVPVPVAIATP